MRRSDGGNPSSSYGGQPRPNLSNFNSIECLACHMKFQGPRAARLAAEHPCKGLCGRWLTERRKGPRCKQPKGHEGGCK